MADETAGARLPAVHVSEATVERHDRRLAVVQRLLMVHGVHSYTVHTVSLRLSGEDGRPIPLGRPKVYAPELVVRGDSGRVATVTVGERSGCYLVSLPGRSDPQAEREPQHVAGLILAARPSGAS
ncbi:hypothetical protein [Streptosporangium sp. NPDC002721]|uniref:hypothetical protein n=1 Tax=Streptosporangium sp. NPDC002721 TaxID=3366188 RepID=UPI0036C83A9D